MDDLAREDRAADGLAEEGGAEAAGADNVDERDDRHPRRVLVVDAARVVDLLHHARKVCHRLSAQPDRQAREEAKHGARDHYVRPRWQERAEPRLREALRQRVDPDVVDQILEDESVRRADTSAHEADQQREAAEARSPLQTPDKVLHGGRCWLDE